MGELGKRVRLLLLTVGTGVDDKAGGNAGGGNKAGLRPGVLQNGQGLRLYGIADRTGFLNSPRSGAGGVCPAGLQPGVGAAQGGDRNSLDLSAAGAGAGGGAGDGTGCGGGIGFGPGVITGGSDGAGAVYQIVDGIVVCDGVPFGGGNLGDGDIFVSVCNGSRIAGFQDYLVAPVRVVVAPIYNGDGGACCRVVEGVVCFVDYSGIIFYFCDLAVVSDYAVVSASDGGWAGVDVVGIAGEGGVRDNFINRKKNCCP